MSKTNATNVEVKYYRHNTVTICKLTFEVPVIEPFSFFELGDIISSIGISSYGANNRMTVIGKSKCDPFDRFDSDLGKRIAEGRAKLKMFKILERINYKVANKLASLQEKCIDTEYNCFMMAQQEQEHLNCLLDG